MKIAKKLFALVVVIAMIAGLSSVAFAAGTYKFDIKAAKDGSDYVKVTLTAKDAVGFKSGSVVLKYDADVLEYDSTEYGKDAAEVNSKVKAEENTFVGQPNGKNAGEVVYGFYFLDTLWSAKDFAAASKRGVTADVNSSSFEAAVFYFKVIDKDATSTKFTLTGTGDVAPTAVTASVKLKKAAPVTDPTEPDDTDPTEEDTTKPSKEDPTKPSKEDPTKPQKDEPTTAKKPEPTTSGKTEPTTNKNQGNGNGNGNGNVNVGPNTGDNGALAIAGAVCALAVAAFVVTKKRK